jgi:hypothetical protein
LTRRFSLLVSDSSPEGARHENPRRGAEPHRPRY